jgi:Cu(I)/Ag(I) efflux system membrane fusion protein
MNRYIFIIISGLLMVTLSCRNHDTKGHDDHNSQVVADVYTCPMHPDIIRDKPGNCPICGMTLVKKVPAGPVSDIDLESLIRPTNEFVISTIPVTTIQKREEQIEIESLGNITYDTRQAGSISSRIAGRIEKLYVRYRYQRITKGQHILDIYSPELVTAQQNLLFLLKNDPSNASFIAAAKEKLLLLGMSESQLQQVIHSGKMAMSIAVYSNYNGHIHEAANGPSMNQIPGAMKDISRLTEELTLKEGMYVQKGQSVFTVFNPDRAWVILNIYGENQGIVKKGNAVRIVPETAPDKNFRGIIDFIEPYYGEKGKTLTARVYFDNSQYKIPIGSQVSSTIFGNTRDAWWLPKESVLSLGMDKLAFIKMKGGFKARKITTGISHQNHIQIISGIAETDSVAANAQYLMDSESFIKIKN